MHMTHKLGIVVMVLALSVSAGAQTQLTLDEAVRIALERRPELKAAEARVSAAQGLKSRRDSSRIQGLSSKPKIFALRTSTTATTLILSPISRR